MWIQVQCGFGLGLLIGVLEWILTPGTPDLYPIRIAAKEELRAKELVLNIKPIGNSSDFATDLLSNK